MIKQIQKTALILLVPTVLASTSSTVSAANADDRYMYVGAIGGISEPVVKDFEETVDSYTTKMRLKQSRMFGGRVGYSFYPGMSIELAAEHQPKYRLAYRLPAITIPVPVPGVVIVNIPVAEAPRVTKISANVFMLNLLYEFQDQYAGVKPYVLFGAGVSRLHIRPQSTAYNLAGVDLITFKIKENKINCYSWQFGGGVTRNITDNFAIDLGAKLRVVHGVKLKYVTLNRSGGFSPQKPIKKTLGVGEFTLGFLFKLPV